MNRLRALLTALLLVPAVPAMAKTDYVYGPPPEWTRYEALGEAAIRAKLADPKVRAKLPAARDWSIEWPQGYTQTGWHHKGRFPGYMTCGRMRAVDPIRDRYPVVNFVAVVDYDAVKTIDISDRASNSLVNVICGALIHRGSLPPAKLVETPRDSEIAALGMTVRSMAEGAYVVAVAPDGTGQHAGLTPGMVIVRVNGIALAGMGPAIPTILASDAARLDLETVTGQHLAIERRR